MASIAPSRRVRRTPFSPGVEAAGVSAYTVYNHMLLPAAFGALTDDYRHLKTRVQVWDVACERQVEITGPDARHLMDLLSPRDLDRMAADQCFYIPVIARDGGMLNDPVALQPEPGRWWISVADGDYWQYALGVADAMGLDVQVHEPDVSPLAIQGPLADDLAARVFGEAVRDLKFFRHMAVNFEGQTWRMARSGYSKQGGFELYVEGADAGMAVWDALMAAGEDLEVRAGCPNLIERIEAGLLSYGSDMTRENTPLECGLGKFVNSPKEFIGKAALAGRPAQQMIRPIAISGDLPPCDRGWPIRTGDVQVGQVTSATQSPDHGTGVGIGMVADSHWAPGTRLVVETQDGIREAEVQAAFWI